MSDGPPEAGDAVVSYVLQHVYPDRLDGEVVGTTLVDEGLLVGVKAYPNGYLSTARYALVTVDDDGGVVHVERCTGNELRRALEGT